jgi:DNA repair protein RadD
VRFSDLMACDEDTLRDLVGQQALGVLRLLDKSADRPSVLRRTLLKVRTPDSLLRDPASRTLLLLTLQPEEAQRLATALGSSGGDPFDYLRRLRIRKNSRQEHALFDWFGLEVPEDPPADTPLTSFAEPAYSLFAHQRAAVRSAWRELETSPNRVLLHMPTGAGKTRTAMNLIADYLRNNEPGLVVWLAYSEELCSQAAEEFEKAWQHLGSREVGVFRFWSDAQLNLDECRDGLVVAGLSKAYSTAKTDISFLSKLSDRAGLVVIDEAHQAVAETYKFVLETLVERRRGVRLLGLSATPGRTWNDPDEDLKLSEFFNRRKVTLSTPPLNPVDFLIDEGYLAQPEFVDIPYSGSELTRDETESIAADLDIPAKVLRRLAGDDQRNLVVVRSVEALIKDHQRVLVFAATVEHAESLAMVLSARGHVSNVVTGSTPKGLRQKLIEDFKREGGPPQVLCNFGVLTTGFDAPRTNAAVIARPTKSLVLYSQMVGRVIRGQRAGGNSSAEIHTVVDSSIPGFGKMSEAFTNWEDVWEDDTNG